ncbi:helix-turn-helix transcriptional regulator [Clostridium algidicarnis]|uniref:helix-turn-helix transcriptional regulator n=1 Tax=Clostridium algidicarnis TaxID=37659 RepID=UPI003FD83A41
MINNIRKIIETRDLKVTDLVNETKISKSYFYDVMNGESIPTLSIARKISGAIGYPLDEVFPDEKEGE